MKIAKSSPSQMKKAMAIADCDDTVRTMYSTTPDTKVHGVVVVADDGMSYDVVTDFDYKCDSDFFKGYLASDCQTTSIPSLGGKF